MSNYFYSIDSYDWNKWNRVTKKKKEEDNIKNIKMICINELGDWVWRIYYCDHGVSYALLYNSLNEMYLMVCETTTHSFFLSLFVTKKFTSCEQLNQLHVYGENICLINQIECRARYLSIIILL